LLKSISLLKSFVLFCFANNKLNYFEMKVHCMGMLSVNISKLRGLYRNRLYRNIKYDIQIAFFSNLYKFWHSLMTIRGLKQILALASVLFDIWASSFTHNRQIFPIGVSGISNIFGGIQGSRRETISYRVTSKNCIQEGNNFFSIKGAKITHSQ
jgi:hypothetical protein